jgi:predicted nucleotidyltransferase
MCWWRLASRATYSRARRHPASRSGDPGGATRTIGRQRHLDRYLTLVVIMATVNSVLDLRHPDMSDPTVLQRIADRLRDELDAKRIILYGSVARGEATIDSDVDLLVVVDTQEKGYIRMARARAAIRDLSAGLPVSPLVLTPQELREGLKRGDAFLQEIEQTGLEL